jgi:hypothetical protein
MAITGAETVEILPVRIRLVRLRGSALVCVAVRDFEMSRSGEEKA